MSGNVENLIQGSLVHFNLVNNRHFVDQIAIVQGFLGSGPTARVPAEPGALEVERLSLAGEPGGFSTENRA